MLSILALNSLFVALITAQFVCDKGEVFKETTYYCKNKDTGDMKEIARIRRYYDMCIDYDVEFTLYDTSDDTSDDSSYDEVLDAFENLDDNK